MRLDPGSNFGFQRAIAPDAHGTGTINGESVDHAKAHSALYFLDVGDVGGGGTVDMKLQYSDDDSSWTDEPDDQANNDTAITQMTAPGQARLEVPNPRGRYTRPVVTVGTNSVDLGVTAIYGPLRHVSY
jgi:hypothetical protein